MKIETCERRHSYDTDSFDVCPFCHPQQAPKPEAPVRTPEQYLPEGMAIAGRYMLDHVEDENDMCIVYSAVDTTNNTRVLMEEFFPLDIAERDTSVSTEIRCTDPDSAERFILGVNIMKEQAGMPLSSLIGRTSDVFEANNTVYVVSERIEWPSLAKWMSSQKALSLMQIFTMLKALTLQLKELHEQQLFHGNLNLQTVHVAKNMTVSAEKSAFYRFKFQHLILRGPQAQNFPLDSGIQLDQRSIAMILFKLASICDLRAICEMSDTSAFFAGFSESVVVQIKPVFLALLNGVTNDALERLWQLYEPFTRTSMAQEKKPENSGQNPVTVKNIDAYFPKVQKKIHGMALKWIFIALVILLAIGAGVIWLLPML